MLTSATTRPSAPAPFKESAIIRNPQAVLLSSLLLLSCAAGELSAQVSAAAGRYRWTYYGSPATAVSARIHAEADLLRAYGEASVDLAAAREIRAQAARREIANSVEYVQAYWDRRSIHEAERLRRYVGPLERKQIQGSRTWARLKDHPDLNGPAIASGDALNFLLDRLAGSALASHFQTSLTTAAVSAGRLALPAATIHSLRMRQELPGGQQLVFRADEGISTGGAWWPFLLRDEAFAQDRQAFEKARTAAIEQASQGMVGLAELRRLLEAYDALESRFAARFPRDVRLKSTELFRHYLTTRRFLQSLGAEIVRLQTAGTIAGVEDLKFTGNTLLALVTHMSRRGLDFAPALPGEEAAYHAVFRLMRDLYITVADDERTNHGGRSLRSP